jgi:3-phosphoshikimate 1-carboxyvinyltransferase
VISHSFISYPSASCQGVITVPGDKSISHRAIMLASIADGQSIIHGCLYGDDCLATIRAFELMGVQIERHQDYLLINGVGKYGLLKPKTAIDCGNAGTLMRLLSGILAAQQFDSVLTGDESLLARPMARICQPLRQMGADILTDEDKPPIVIGGHQILHGIAYNMPEASAQVKSCILLAGLYATGETRVIEPEITRDHTERMLGSFSYPVKKIHKTVSIDGAHSCVGTEITIPGDLSSAAFFIVAATLINGAKLCIKNVGVNPTRTGFLDILRLMGADIVIYNQREWGQEPVADMVVRYAPLHGITIPRSFVATAIDEFPILFIAAACATGQTILRGAQELRFKESNRIDVMADGLNRLGIDACALDDGILIHGGVLQGGCIDSHSDHRVAMAFAIAGLVAQSPITIQHCNQVSTSFPDFLTLANQLNLSIRVMNEDI